MNKFAQVIGWGFIGFILLSFGIGIGLAAFDSLSATESTPELERVQDNFSSSEYSPSEIGFLKREYVKGCSPNGSQDSYCQCTFDYLEDRIGIEGILDIGERYGETDYLPIEMQNAVSYCLDNPTRSL